LIGHANKVIDYVSPYAFVVGNFFSNFNIVRNVYVNLNKLDDPKITQKDKAVDIAKSVAVLS
jgi:hypothetical protein